VQAFLPSLLQLQNQGMAEVDPKPCLHSGDTDRVRACQLQHTVEDTHSDAHFGRSALGLKAKMASRVSQGRIWYPGQGSGATKPIRCNSAACFRDLRMPKIFAER
jgi:hypothetical protein